MMEVNFLLGSFFLTKIILPVGVGKMKRLGLTAKNFRGEALPMPAGLIPIIIFLFMLALGGFIKTAGALSFLLIFTLLAFLGLLDDLFGEETEKGLKGHFKAFLKGNITTGIIKAIGGFCLAFLSAWFFGEKELFAICLVINSFLIAFSTNLINLFDLRPGRALKVFLSFVFLLIIFIKGRVPYWLYPLIGATIAYLPWDLGAKVMLGDTGSNVLGFALGLAVVICLGIKMKIVIVFFLFIIHLYTENISLSKVIEGNSFLKFLDCLGRAN